MIRQRGIAEVSTKDPLKLEDVDLVSLDGVKVVIHCQEDLIRNRRGERLTHSYKITHIVHF